MGTAKFLGKCRTSDARHGRDAASFAGGLSVEEGC